MTRLHCLAVAVAFAAQTIAAGAWAADKAFANRIK